MAKTTTATATNGNAPDLLASIQQLLAIDEATLDAAIDAAREKVKAATGELNQLMLLKRSIDMRAGRLTRKKPERRAKKAAVNATDYSVLDRIHDRLTLQFATPKTLATDLALSEGEVLRTLSANPKLYARRPDGTYCIRREE